MFGILYDLLSYDVCVVILNYAFDLTYFEDTLPSSPLV